LTDERCFFASEGCTGALDFQVGFYVWAEGHSKADSAPAGGMSSLCVCANCKEKVTVNDLLSPEAKAGIKNSFIGQGKAAPNFDTAEMRFVEVIDGEPVSVMQVMN
jgi:hypothetical protein